MKKIILLVTLTLVACAPLDAPDSVTPLPFYASETPPPLIVPVTDLPTETAIPLIAPVTETPFFAAGPTWWDVYFTAPQTLNNPDFPADSIEEKLIQFIDAAQSSIHIASFEFNLPRVADALISARARGVDVRWVTDDENGLNIDNQPGRGLFTRLLQNGIEVKDDGGRSALMHNKFWIFDERITWTGSTNITVNGVYKQNNNVIVIYSTEIAYIYEREWNELWAGQFGPRAPSNANNQWAILEGAPVQVLFSSEDRVINNLIALVNDAQVNIRFLAFSFTDYPLAQTMIDRARSGVDVQGVYETFGSMSEGSELKTFWCAGVPVRQDGNSSFLHDKILIIDNSIVVTGSLNFSSNADDSNEENILIIDNAEIAALYLREYQQIWDAANDVPAGTFACP